MHVDRLLPTEANGAEFYNQANGSDFSVLDVISTCRESPVNRSITR